MTDFLSSILLAFFIISIVLFVAVLTSSIVVILRHRGSRIKKIVIGLALLAVWVFLTYLHQYIKGNTTFDIHFSSLLTIVIIVAGLLNISTAVVVPRTSFFPVLLNKMIFYIGFLLIGLLSFQLYNPEIKVVWINTESYLPRIEMDIFFGVLFTFWGFLVILFLWITAVKTRHKQKIEKKKITTVLYSLGIVGIFVGLVSYIFEYIISVYLDSPFILVANFIFGRVIVLLALNFLLFSTYIDATIILTLSRIIYHLFERKEISLSLSRFEETGPETAFYYGFDFVQNIRKRENYIQKISIITMTLLGMGSSYIRGSALIPLPGHEEYTGMVLTDWVCDEKEKDPRLCGKRYISLIIVLPRSLEWLFYPRHLWESSFQQFIGSIDRVNILDTKEEFIHYVIEQLNNVALAT